MSQDIHCFSKEFTFISDNDAYAALGTDRYYTNGTMLNFSFVTKHHYAYLLKQINHWQAGQLMYNAQRRRILQKQIYDIDRPIAGYLYINFSKSNFYRNKAFFKYGIYVGTVGAYSFAENVQHYVHEQMYIKNKYWEWVWNYQVQNEPGLNLEAAYGREILDSKYFKLTPLTQITLGTSFTNIKQTAALQIGKFSTMHTSSFWDAAIGCPVQNEFFFFYKPELLFQLYNATIQGGMLRSYKGPIISSIKPFVFTHELGLMLSRQRYSVSTHVFFQSKEASRQVSNHAYGRIQLAYRFK